MTVSSRCKYSSSKAVAYDTNWTATIYGTEEELEYVSFD